MSATPQGKANDGRRTSVFMIIHDIDLVDVVDAAATAAAVETFEIISCKILVRWWE